MLGLLQELATLLERKRTRGEIFVIGGGAMILAGYSDSRVSHDLDGHITAGHSAVTNAVREVGRNRGLPGTWLNEQATAFMPKNPDPRAVLVFNHSSLRVTAASAEYLLAMKLSADRPQDQLDCIILAKHLGMDRTGAAALIVKFYGDDALTTEIEDSIATAIPLTGFAAPCQRSGDT